MEGGLYSVIWRRRGISNILGFENSFTDMSMEGFLFVHLSLQAIQVIIDEMYMSKNSGVLHSLCL